MPSSCFFLSLSISLSWSFILENLCKTKKKIEHIFKVNLWRECLSASTSESKTVPNGDKRMSEKWVTTTIQQNLGPNMHYIGDAEISIRKIHLIWEWAKTKWKLSLSHSHSKYDFGSSVSIRMFSIILNDIFYFYCF